MKLLICILVILAIVSCGKDEGTTVPTSVDPGSRETGNPISLCAGKKYKGPELPTFGVCSGGVMFGVYENTGEVLELPPGTYKSKEKHPKCSFTIKADCVVEE